MSLESVAIVLNHSRAKGTAKLALIGIANHDGDGGAYPGIDTLCAYTNANRATVQRAITRLEIMGEVTRKIQQGGDRDTPDHDRTNRYDVLVVCPPTCDRTKRHTVRCLTCGKRLLNVHRYLLTHPYCAPWTGGRVFVNVTPQEGAAFSKTRPELKQPPERHFPSLKVLNREATDEENNADGFADAIRDADASEGATAPKDTCPRWKAAQPHAYSPRTGKCIDCGQIETTEDEEGQTR